jgi:hypothetical protein
MLSGSLSASVAANLTVVSRTRADGWAFIRDRDGDCCLIMPPYRVGDIILVGDDAADKSIVAPNDFIPCGRDFPNWRELVYYLRRSMAH